ncbi:MAG: SpoIVB peptidase [Acetivibrio sp.]
MNYKKLHYRRILILALIFNIILIGMVYFFTIDAKIPNKIMMFAGQEEEFAFETPVVGVFSGNNPMVKEKVNFDFAEPVSLKIDNTGTYAINLQLFGFIHLKNVELNVVETQKLIPGGENIGIYVETKGIMVLGSGSVTGRDGIKHQPAENIIKTGDYILSVNGKKVEKIQEMTEELNHCSSSPVILEVVRNQQLQSIKVAPVEISTGEFKLGIWVRDNTQGVGTLTYRTKEGKFGALGHGITDHDTGLTMEIEKGDIYDTEIIDIIKGTNGKPGEVVGIIRSSESMKMGKIYRNTDSGIFGTIISNESLWKERQELPIGLKQEVKKGNASILCALDGEIEEYEIEIEKIKWNSEKDSKGMIIRITDPKLLKKTNGIIQGMSGSPILQNGKIIGAVTHVFIQDSAKGYGIFIENMMKK